MKFRIAQIIHNVGELSKEHSRSKIEYVIERKKLFGWREVFNKEVYSVRISHKTYEDAESYMIARYMGHGLCEKRGNVYTYIRYTYPI